MVFLEFMYTEALDFQHATLGELLHLHRCYRLAKGTVPVDDALDVLNNLPQPAS